MSEHEPEQVDSDKVLSKTDFAAVYKEQHPNAIENEGKAHMMAAEGDSAESFAARQPDNARAHLETAQTPGVAPDERDNQIKKARENLREMDTARGVADGAEDLAAADYDRAQEILDAIKPGSEK